MVFTEWFPSCQMVPMLKGIGTGKDKAFLFLKTGNGLNLTVLGS